MTAEPDAMTAEPNATTAEPDAVTAGDYADEIPSSPRIKRWEVLNQYLRSSNYCVIIITNVIFLSIGPDVQIPPKISMELFNESGWNVRSLFEP